MGVTPSNRALDTERAKAALAEPEPTVGDPARLVDHLIRRANAHGFFADRKQEERELQRALEVASANPALRSRVFGALSNFENRSGSLIAARDYTASWVEASRARPPDVQFLPLQRQVYYANRLGDRATAERAMAEMDELVKRARRWPGWDRSGEYWTALQERARGRIHELHGNLAAAEQSAQTALASAERYLAKQAERAPTQEGREQLASATGFIELIARDLASYQRDQGNLLAAELSARKALGFSLRRIGFASSPTARSLQMLARIVVEQGRYAEGEGLAREALRSAEAAGLDGASDVLLHARAALGTALAMQGRWEEAATVFAIREAGLQDSNPELRKAVRLENLDWVMALIKTGKHERARSLVNEFRARFESFGDGTASIRVAYYRGFLGLSYVEAGEPQRAMLEFQASVPQILEAAFRSQREEREGPAGIARMNAILEGYMRALVEVNRSRPEDAAAEIFQVADFARASRVQRALTLGAARAAARDPALKKLVEEDERLLDRVTVLSGLMGELSTAQGEKRLDQVIGRMSADLAGIERERKALRGRIEREFPGYANLVAPKPVTLEDARRALRPGEALLSIYLSEDRAYIWGISREGDPAIAIVLVTRAEIAKMVAELRKALDVGVVHVDQFPAFDVALAHRLYAQLVLPVEGTLRGAKTLLVAPHGSLGQIPFGLLVTKPANAPGTGPRFEDYRQVPWLVRDVAVVQLPAVSSLVALGRIPAPPENRRPFVGFGDPVFSKDQTGVASTRGVALRNLGVARADASAQLARLPPLPDTREEVTEIARVLRADAGKDIHVGAAASKRNVDQAHLADRRVIAFATHGLVAGDLDGLTQPALALSSPEVTGFANDGLLLMEEILGLRLNADWVVLSACNTAAAEGAGEEAVSGLGRAFFYAGARALLASNWPVETISARLLTTDVFRRQATDPKLTRAEALRQSILNLLDQETAKDASGKAHFAYAHPMFWAPFSLVGDGN